MAHGIARPLVTDPGLGVPRTRALSVLGNGVVPTASGADLKEMQEIFGHAGVATTSNIYTSVLLEFQREHADTAADLIPLGHPPQRETRSTTTR
jgi:hypothetical protein